MDKDTNIYIFTPNRKGFGDSGHNMGPTLEELNDNIEVIFAGTASDTFFYNATFQFHCWKSVRRLVRELDIDIIHSESAMPDIMLSPEKIKAPIITTIHTTIRGQVDAIKKSQRSLSDLERSEQMQLLFNLPLDVLERRYYHSNRYYMTVSAWAKNDLVKTRAMVAERIRVVYNGIDTQLFNPRNRANALEVSPDLFSSNPNVLYLSRLVERKGLGILLESMPEVIKKTRVNFLIGGAGKRPSLDESISKFLGYVSHDDKPNIYGASDIFVLPSLYENFPISLLEAMASGVAVIGTNVGGIPEMIDDRYNGLLIDPDAKKLASAIVELAEDETLRKNLCHNARNTVQEKFTWEAAAEETMSYYSEVLNGEISTG